MGNQESTLGGGDEVLKTIINKVKHLTIFKLANWCQSNRQTVNLCNKDSFWTQLALAQGLRGQYGLFGITNRDRYMKAIPQLYEGLDKQIVKAFIGNNEELVINGQQVSLPTANPMFDLTSGLVIPLIDSLPDSIGNLKNLKTLVVNNTELSSLPYSIGNLKNLQTLDVSDNKLSSLPDSIGNLKHLQKLNLSDNELTSLPNSIGNLKHLKTLDVSDNELSSLPQSIMDLILSDNFVSLVGITPEKLDQLIRVTCNMSKDEYVLKNNEEIQLKCKHNEDEGEFLSNISYEALLEGETVKFETDGNCYTLDDIREFIKHNQTTISPFNRQPYTKRDKEIIECIRSRSLSFNGKRRYKKDKNKK